MDYPVSLDVAVPERVANWRPLVNWILAIPHLLIANVLGNVGGVIALISWFAILFTGQLPEGLANLQCLVIRYQQRAYAYALFLHEQYPKFEFAMTPQDPGGDAVRLTFAPQLENRNRLTVGLRILWAIPYLLFTAALLIAGVVVVVIGFFAVLFTGQWPEGLRNFVIGVMRVSARASSYVYLLNDQYPPFALD